MFPSLVIFELFFSFVFFDEDNKLRKAVQSSLILASEKGFKSISIPAICSGCSKYIHNNLYCSLESLTPLIMHKFESRFQEGQSRMLSSLKEAGRDLIPST